MEIKNISVIGSGTMGNGIAHTFALFGYKVLLIDVKEAFIERGLNTIKTNLERQVKKGAINEEQMKSTLANIETSTSLSSAGFSDLVIEAATENFEIKKDIFKTLDDICNKDVFLLRILLPSR